MSRDPPAAGETPGILTVWRDRCDTRRDAMRTAEGATIPVRDRQIRAALVEHLRAKDASAAILHELPLRRGEHRADVAYVNGVLAGYEIKSDGDSLARLPGQVDGYESVFEYSTVVIAPRHLKATREVVPKRWGIMVVEVSPNGLWLRDVRQPKRNQQVDRRAVVRLLWKEECVAALRSQGIRVNHDDLVSEIWPKVEALPIRTLCNCVRTALKARDAVGSDPP